MNKLNINWAQKRLQILLGLRLTFNPDIKTTSAQLECGTTLCLSGDLFHQRSNFQPQTVFVKELEKK